LCAAVVAGAWLGAADSARALEGVGQGWLDLGLLDPDRMQAAVWRPLVLAALVVWLAALALDSKHARVFVLVLAFAIAGDRGSQSRARAEEVRAADVHRAWTGTWEEVGTSAEDVRGRLANGSPLFLVARGAIADGDVVAIRPTREVQRLPRGPELGPRAASGSEPLIDVQPDEVARLAGARGGPLALLQGGVRDLRARLLRRTQSIRDPLTRSLVAALVLGDTSGLPEEVPDLFIRTGTFHILAVSGMQVVLVLLFLILPLSRAIAALVAWLSRGRVRASAEWIAVPWIALFVPIAGSGAPVVRSAIGCALTALAPRLSASRAVHVVRAGKRVTVRLPTRADALSLWCLALILECVAHADAPTSLSVQLSYAATLGLVVGTQPILAWLRPRDRNTGWIAPVNRLGHARSPWWRIPCARGLDTFACAVAASIAAVLATLPFVWTRLGEWSPFGILATPALATSMTALLVFGWLRVLCPPLAPDLLLDPCAHAMKTSMQLFDLLPGTPAPLAPRPLFALALAVALTFVALRGFRRSRWVGRCAALVWAALLVPWAAAPAKLELWMLDVGAGTATVMRAPGLGTWIFDAGSRDRPDVAREAVGPLLRRLDVAHVGIALSHLDRDHDSGLAWVVERFPPRVWAGALPLEQGARLPHETLRLDLGAGRIDLPPLAGAIPGVRLCLERGLDVPGNEGSRSLRIAFGADELVLCGDAETEGLSAWLRTIGPSAPLRLVSWPHHGSECDRIEPFLSATKPREVWISAGAEPPIAPELDRRGQRWRWTTRDGPLSIELDGGFRADRDRSLAVSPP
jgi:beta-lactamase superfamily II metal-dependent hydrolase